MHNSNMVRFLIGAGLGAGFVDPFTPTRMCAARLHPRRDPDGHDGGGNGGGTNDGGSGGSGSDGGNAGGGDAGGSQDDNKGSGSDSASDDWSKTFEGMTPTEVKKALDESRRWENRSKENHPKAEKYDALVKALNGDGKGDTPPDPNKLASDLTAAQQGERDAKVESAVLRQASRHSVNGDKLTDSIRFMDGLRALELDPKSADFSSKVDDAIKAALAEDSSLALAGHQGPKPNPQQGKPSGNTKASSVDAGKAMFDAKRGNKSK